MKIYTKDGDYGTTSLFGGKRVGKDSRRIDAYGYVDELNSLVGTILAENPNSNISKKLLRIQTELFVLGSDLATPREVRIKIPRVTKSFTNRLKKEIDIWEKKLPGIKNFILPGGGKIASKLHLARTVARRAERSVVSLSKEESINNNALIYINRLSDWFFVAARDVNKLEKIKEAVWKGRGI